MSLIEVLVWGMQRIENLQVQILDGSSPSELEARRQVDQVRPHHPSRARHLAESATARLVRSIPIQTGTNLPEVLSLLLVQACVTWKYLLEQK